MSDIKTRIINMANKIAEEEQGVEDTPLEMVDQAIDTIIASLMVMDKYLPQVKAQNVPEQAALDAIRELMDEAVAPYMADIAKAAQTFGD